MLCVVYEVQELHLYIDKSVWQGKPLPLNMLLAWLCLQEYSNNAFHIRDGMRYCQRPVKAEIRTEPVGRRDIDFSLCARAALLVHHAKPFVHGTSHYSLHQHISRLSH
jgi:hypothetical protein